MNVHNASERLPLLIAPTPSRWLRALVIGQCGVALLALRLLWPQLSTYQQFAVILLLPLAATLVIGAWRRTPALGGAPCWLRLDGMGWGWWLPNATALPHFSDPGQRLAGDSYCSRWLVILRFEGGRPRQLVIPRDALPAALFRQLRVRLRLQRTGEAG